MRTLPSHERVTAKQPLHLHQLRWTVDYQYAADELRTALLNASRSAPFGKRTERHRQLEKNLQSYSNCAPETFVELLFKAQDLGVATETLVAVADTLASLIRARRPRTQQLPLKELLAAETEIESATNPIQWKLATGQSSTMTEREFLELARKNLAIWTHIVAEQERVCFPPPRVSA